MHTECLGLVCRECGKRIPEAECALSCPDCGAPMRVMFSEASLRQALSAGCPLPKGVHSSVSGGPSCRFPMRRSLIA